MAHHAAYVHKVLTGHGWSCPDCSAYATGMSSQAAAEQSAIIHNRNPTGSRHVPWGGK